MIKKRWMLLAAGLTAATIAPAGVAAGNDQGVTLTPLGAYETGEEGGAEIVAYASKVDRAYVTNGATNSIDIIDMSDPAMPSLVGAIDLSPYGDGVQSVATSLNRVAAAVKAEDDTQPGTVILADLAGNVTDTYEVGVLPDSIAFSHNGRFLVVANEAEPVCDDEELVVDPPGSISVIDLVRGQVSHVGFEHLDGMEDELREQGIRIFGPGGTASADLEPEYVAIDEIGTTAFVTLQENNAVAVVNLRDAELVDLLPLGYKDHSVDGQGLDPSNRDDAESTTLRNVLGMYMPDAIAAYRPAGGQHYLVTANEGDARDYDCYSEEVRVSDFAPGEGIAEGLGDAYSAADIEDEELGRLKTTTAFPTVIGDDGKVEQVYSYGARSFSIWSRTGELVFDSGDDFEDLLRGTPYYNLDEDETDGRSDDKGAEPEALAVGQIGQRSFAFVGLERSGGIAVYDITDPANSKFETYVNTLDMGDISPEGIVFVPKWKSPTGNAMLVVSFEVSGSTRAFDIELG